MARRWRRGRRRVERLADTLPAGAPGALAAWHVLVLTDAEARRLYTTMARDVAHAIHRARTPLIDGYAQAHGIGKLVLVETYACRHTAFARMRRIRAWPMAERRRLIEASNPDWRDLAPREDGAGKEKPTMRGASPAAA